LLFIDFSSNRLRQKKGATPIRIPSTLGARLKCIGGLLFAMLGEGLTAPEADALTARLGYLCWRPGWLRIYLLE
jgi:hypothetical protein